MAHCCEDKACEVTLLRERHRYVLKLVLAVNAAMFTLEAVFGWLAHSTSLLADSLDMFGDATVYAMSLYAVEASRRRQGMVALIKAMIMLAFGLGVFAEAGWKMLHPILPEARLMGLIGWLALLANLACFLLLVYTQTR
jgi:Co/Zn/Cd efflux system component